MNKTATKALDKNYLEMTSPTQPLVQFQNNFHWNVSHYNALYQNYLNGSAPLSKLAARAVDKKYLLLNSISS